MRKLALENHEGKTVRTFWIEGTHFYVIHRHETKRVEVHSSTQHLENAKIKFTQLGEFSLEQIQGSPVAIGSSGQIRLVEEVGATVKNAEPRESSNRSWYMSLALLILFMGSFMGIMMNRPMQDAKLEQELKQQLVQIVKRIQPKPKTEKVTATESKEEVKEVKEPVAKRTASIKRMGALSVLGSLNSGKQRGGLNLGAVNTTAGPGLGGTQGSGGVQTTLYGKGLVAAPLGAGSNMQGAGGYGTKGKGGGQAGYGKMSLIGSAGSASIPLGREAIIDGGLDRDLIADVINRNMGQVRFCYEQGLQGDPALAGRVAIAFTIGGNGQVKVAGIDTTTLNSKMVEDCIVMRLRSWKFPLPQGGVDVKVSYPFVLRRTGQG